MRWGILSGAVMAAAVGLAGCGGRTSSVLLERKARGELSDVRTIGALVRWTFEPVTLSQTQGGLQVTVNYASADFQRTFFGNRDVFGRYAGPSPYAPEHLVFYVIIANQSGQKVAIDPMQFVLIDDLGNQYNPIGSEPVIAFAEVRRPVASTTRGILREASPGYFGFSVPVGKMFVHEPQGPFALLRQSSLQSGYLYSGVVHDGLVAFWNPAPAARRLTFHASNIKTDFDANDVPESSFDFAFEFDVTSHQP